MKEYKPLNMFTKQTDELKELIAKYPDYPIVVMVANEVVANDFYGWWYAPSLRFSIGEILDCEQEVNDERTYTDRDEFEEDMVDMLCNQQKYDEFTDEDFNEVVQEELKKYDSYWKNVIQIINQLQLVVQPMHVLLIIVYHLA